MDKETKKMFSNLCNSVDAMQAEIAALKNGATGSGKNPAGSHDSDLVSGISPLNKRRKTAPEGSDSEEDQEEEPFVDLRGNGGNGGSTKLVEMSEEEATFIEAAFKTKLKNSERVECAEKYGVPDLRWLKYPELDPVVAATIPTSSDRSASRLQNFWLDAANPLIYVLEKAEELELPSEVIVAIKAYLQLLGNASAQNTIDRRKAMLVQMSSQLKGFMGEADFKEAAPLLFGDNFATLDKETLDAAAALKKTLGNGDHEKQPQRDFYKSHSQKYGGRGGGSHYNSGQFKQRDGNPAAANLPSQRNDN